MSSQLLTLSLDTYQYFPVAITRLLFLSFHIQLYFSSTTSTTHFTILLACFNTSSISISVLFNLSKFTLSNPTFFSTYGHLSRCTSHVFPPEIYLLITLSSSLKATLHSSAIVSVVVSVSCLQSLTNSSFSRVLLSCWRTAERGETSDEMLKVVSCAAEDERGV